MFDYFNGYHNLREKYKELEKEYIDLKEKYNFALSAIKLYQVISLCFLILYLMRVFR